MYEADCIIGCREIGLQRLGQLVCIGDHFATLVLELFQLPGRSRRHAGELWQEQYRVTDSQILNCRIVNQIEVITRIQDAWD